MRRALDRVVETVPVEILAAGSALRGVSQDLSPGGMFVRSKTVLPIGTACELLVHVVQPPMRIAARVAHVLPPDEARSLGRIAGLGFVFEDLHGDRRSFFERHVAEVVASQAPARAPQGSRMRVVVADGHLRLLERLSTALSHAGFAVTTATNGAEAYAACLAAPPDVLICALHMPIFSGMRLLRTMGEKPALAQVPVLMMSEDASDLRRLEAYQLGAMDFVPKPFTVVEMCIRARRLAMRSKPRAGRVVLRGTLAELALPTLLTMFEQEQKTGVLAVTCGDDVAWLSLRAGRVVRAQAAGSDWGSRDTLMRVLDWSDGFFELTACEVEDEDEIAAGLTHMLLEHARLCDERARS